MATVRQETEQFRPDVVSFVNQELQRDVNYKSYGYHGTSVHTLLTMLHTGVIPGRTAFNNPHFAGFPKLGDVYFWRSGTGYTHPVYAIRECLTYAKIIARKHSLLHELGLPFKNSDYIDAAIDVTMEDMSNKSWIEQFEFLLRQGLSDTQIKTAIANAQKLEGVLMGISQQVADKFTIVNCAPDDGWKIETHTGLPFHYIQGIQFLSLYDEQLFRRHIK